MASPSLILWTREDSPSPPPPPPIPKPKPKRTSKPSKKIPQRGLGVAQLEQIRLQNKISSVDRGEMEAFSANLPVSVYGAPVVYTGSGQICYVPQLRVGYGPVSAVRSVLHEQYAMDRDRARAASVGELPSNQRACVSSDLCQFCSSRKKRVLSDDLGSDGGNGVLSRYFGAMDEELRNHRYSAERMGSIFAKEREIKEYDFFPHNLIKESNGGDLGFEEQTVGGSPSSSTGGAAANYMDLSLKLF